MSHALDFLLELLDLETIEVNIFRGRHTNNTRQRTFGGQIAAQALMAAGRTVERGRVHSLHSYFLRPGDSSAPTLFEVDRIRDGRSFATRRVVAIQHGQPIYNLQASFHSDESSLEHQVTMPDVPGPDTLASARDVLAQEVGVAADWMTWMNPIEQRYVTSVPWSHDRPRQPSQRLWIRADGPLPDDPLLHACVVTYASDMNLFDTILANHDTRFDDPGFMGASLDHCMWFHRDLRADEWLLYDMDSPIAHGARGLARGFLFSADGLLRVSMVQEGLARMIAPLEN